MPCISAMPPQAVISLSENRSSKAMLASHFNRGQSENLKNKKNLYKSIAYPNVFDYEWVLNGC